jgi:alcohol dehydrogenase
MTDVRITTATATYIGWGTLKHVFTEADKYKGKILVVSDPVLVKIGVLDQLTLPLSEKGFSFDVYSDIIPEPEVKTAQQLVNYTRNGNYSLIIGIGGGSALDLAKLAAVFTHNPGDVTDYLNLTGTLKLQHKGIPKILIPTTSGTGTEVTNISVLALEHSKDVITHDFLLADVAIVDAQLTVTVPPKVTAATGADALTHAIEAYISVNANPYSDALALEAIRLIGGSLKRVVKNGDDKSARIAMAYGSYLAGLAFFNAGVGAIHALAYPLGGQFHVAHGDSNAVLIPYVLGYIRHTCAERLATILTALGYDRSEKTNDDAASFCVETLATLMKEIEIPETPAGFGIPASAAKQLAADGIKQKRLLARCPMQLTEHDILEIYQAAFTGVIPQHKAAVLS